MNILVCVRIYSGIKLTGHVREVGVHRGAIQGTSHDERVCLNFSTYAILAL